MSNVQLRLGDMFDGPSDLIVLPCSTGGTITSFVRQKLLHHNIPAPKAGMRLGDIEVMPFEGGENIAQYVAYAASVERNRSDAGAIRRIGVQLGECTQQGYSVRMIAAPLLGAGAGGLQSEVVVDALREGFKLTGHKDATLVINVLHDSVFNLLGRSPGLGSPRRAEESSRGQPNPSPLRVFVSYTHSSPAHQEWVKDLGEFLRKNGVEARLDVWHLRRGMDLPQFMTNELALADRVILISDEKYAEKADGRVGGVGWETMIIQGDLSRLPPDTIKYLVVVRSAHIDSGLPQYLKTKFVIHWPDSSVDDQNRRLLLQELFDQIAAPPIGPRPIFI
ncbi:MAG: TIR domain-containing protein [Gemmatimonadota bacterium]